MMFSPWFMLSGFFLLMFLVIIEWCASQSLFILLSTSLNLKLIWRFLPVTFKLFVVVSNSPFYLGWFWPYNQFQVFFCNILFLFPIIKYTRLIYQALVLNIFLRVSLFGVLIWIIWRVWTAFTLTNVYLCCHFILQMFQHLDYGWLINIGRSVADDMLLSYFPRFEILFSLTQPYLSSSRTTVQNSLPTDLTTSNTPDTQGTLATVVNPVIPIISDSAFFDVYNVEDTSEFSTDILTALVLPNVNAAQFHSSKRRRLVLAQKQQVCIIRAVLIWEC